MHPHTGAEPDVDARRLIVEVPAAQGDESDGEVPDLALGRPPRRHGLRSLPPIDEQAV